MLVSEAENTIRINSGVRNVYTFSHADFEGVKFYSARQYTNLTRGVREEEFFVNEE